MYKVVKEHFDYCVFGTFCITPHGMPFRIYFVFCTFTFLYHDHCTHYALPINSFEPQPTLHDGIYIYL